MSALTPRMVFRNNLSDLGLLEASTGIVLSDTAQRVAVVLENRIDGRLGKDRMLVRIGHAELARAVRRSKETVKRAMRELKAAGLVRVSRSHNQHTVATYEVLVLPSMYGAGQVRDLVVVTDADYQPKKPSLVGVTGDPYQGGDRKLVGVTGEVGRGHRLEASPVPVEEPAAAGACASPRAAGSYAPAGAVVHIDDDRPAPPWANTRVDGLAPIAESFPIKPKPKRRYDIEDPTRPDDAEDYDVHDTCGWTYGHLKHITECVEKNNDRLTAVGT